MYSTGIPFGSSNATFTITIFGSSPFSLYSIFRSRSCSSATSPALFPLGSTVASREGSILAALKLVRRVTCVACSPVPTCIVTTIGISVLPDSSIGFTDSEVSASNSSCCGAGRLTLNFLRKDARGSGLPLARISPLMATRYPLTLPLGSYR